jgi:hypothetical protein
MSDRTNLGKSNARNSARRRQGGGLLDIADALGLTIDDLYPVWELRLADGRIVRQRGADGVDAARRYHQISGEQATGVRPAQEPHR